MQEDFCFDNLSGCERVKLILEGILPDAFYLWRAKAHVETCILCQSSHPNVVALLFDQIRREESALIFEVEEIRGNHIREASAIGREAILSRPDAEVFPLDAALLASSYHFRDEAESGAKAALQLLTSLAKAGKRIKDVFTTIHGFGLVTFQVVVNLNDSEEEFAWKDCAGLIQRLSSESREFVFSAALAAELLPDLALLSVNPEYPAEAPTGVHVGVLYKAIQTAASRYLETYLLQNPPGRLSHPGPDIHDQRGKAEVLSNISYLHEAVGEQTGPDQEKIENLLQGQTAMMDRLAAIEKAARELLEASHGTDDAIKRLCEATLRNALKLQFDDLEVSTRDFLLAAEYGYTQFPPTLDFSSVAVSLTKAFEVEFRRAVKPILDKLQQIAISDTSFKGDLSNLTLGGFYHLFRKNRSSVEPLFRLCGLAYEDVCTAIDQVNREKQAKHVARVNKADATRFRALFLGRPSVLAALLPAGER